MSFSFSAKAAEVELDEIYNLLPQSAKEYVDSNDSENDIDAGLTLKVLRDFIGNIKDYLAAPIRLLYTIIGCVFLRSVASSLPQNDSLSVKIGGIVSSGLGWLLVYKSSLYILRNSAFLIEITEYLSKALPIFAALLAGGGMVSSSSLVSLVLSIVCGSGVLAIKNVTFCIAGICTGICAISSITDNSLDRLVSSACRFWGKILSGSFSAFLLFLKMQSSIALASDSASIRAGKFAISSSIPIVGSAVSDSTTAIIGSLQLIKSQVGILAVASLLAIMLPPVAEAVLIYGAVYVGELFCDMCADQNFLKTIISIKSICGLYAAFRAVIGVVSIFSVYYLMISVGGSI